MVGVESVMRPLALPDLNGRTILVVDDNDDALDMLGTFLRACGAHVLETHSARGALTYIDTHPHIDVLITDLSMPEMDGTELVRRLRAHSSRSDIPAIALTGFHEFYMNTSDFTAFLRKPADLDRLCTAINEAIEKGHPRAPG
jgi:CheY-like chemotaxis protein